MIVGTPLYDSDFAPALWRPERLGVESAWYRHVPFAFWLVAQARPNTIVELGVHNGVSYSAFCQAVDRLRLPTRCFAVDTWKGDEHAGHYGEEVFADFARFHERHSGFSTMLRMTFDEAAATFTDRSIDFLHIDGLHTYEAIRHDYETWLPLLSDNAIVLFHDVNVREREFGVWRLWSELRARHPGFEFLHGSGLGVLAPGPETPPVISTLNAITDETALAGLRHCFSLLGDRWHAEARILLGHKQIEDLYRDLGSERHRAEKLSAELQAIKHKGDSLTGAALRDRALIEHALWNLQRQLEHERTEYSRALVAEQTRAEQLGQAQAAILRSTTWRALAPVRVVGDLVPRTLRRPFGRTHAQPAAATLPAPDSSVASAPPPEPFSEPSQGSSGAAPEPGPQTPRLLFISGEPQTPGHVYRVRRAVEAATRAGASARWMTVDQATQQPELAEGNLGIIVWRARHTQELAAFLDAARRAGSKIVLDIDDLMFRPELAITEIVDGIRSQGFGEVDVRAHFTDILHSVLSADLCLCPTAELAQHIREFQKPAQVIPNGFDEEQHRMSRLLVRERDLAPQDDLLRVGYAGGTRTHQRDFAVAAPAVAEFLRSHPKGRLVLFQTADGTLPLLDVDEYPDLLTVSDQIEWRSMVPLDRLPEEIARFDINLAPLEAGNPFCEAKSELKYFEAALLDIPTIASPAGPFARAIDCGRTGYLAESESEWTAFLSQLADDPALRRRMGHAAYLDVLWRYGTPRRIELFRSLIGQLQGGAAAASAFELSILRERFRSRKIPDLAERDIVFRSDKLCNAAAAVVIPLYNYAQYIEEALESVSQQTERLLDLVVVDDASRDRSLAIAENWAQANAPRFNRVVVARHARNAGLAATRNTGFDLAEAEFVMPLDADNRLTPHCIERCLAVARQSGAGFVYPTLRRFGDEEALLPAQPFDPARLIGGNYIDAMALVAKWVWSLVEGYQRYDLGWEDYEFWCRCVEHGVAGAPAEDALAEYRVHGQSMLHQLTDIEANKRQLVAELEERHSWLSVALPE